MKNKAEGDIIKEMEHLIRIVEALSSAAISIAFAVFVIVYLFNPITF